MWEKVKNLSTGVKAGIIGGTVLLAAAGIGLGITQPWNRPAEVPEDPDIRQQEPAQPLKEPEKGLSLSVDGKEIPCVLYEGTGWSIYVPEDWSTEQLGENGGLFSSGDGAQLSVRFEPGSSYSGRFINLSAAGDSRVLQFYHGSGEGSPVVEGSVSAAKWDEYDRLFVAMARTLTVGDAQPFKESYVIPQEPDWQTADGLTVLFLDKDGYVVDDSVQETIESFMEGWPEEDREVYTGQYRINALTWAASYTGITKDGFVDVFRADVQYRVRDGAAPAGVNVVNGWADLGSGAYLAVFHDGGTVSQTKGVMSALEDGWTGFASQIA